MDDQRANADAEITAATFEPEELDNPPRVLMIDDSRAICMAVQSRLTSGNEAAFVAVNDPKLAVTTARDFRPTVILLDLEMPEISGFELLGALRADRTTRDIPVIMLSGTTDPAVKANAFMLGANDYAEKHMNAVELNSRIAYHTRAYLSELRLAEHIRELRETKRQLEIQRDFIRKTFGRYVSDEVVDSLLATPDGLELGGEKRVVSIMMADLRGFTTMSEGLSPENVLAVINNFLRTMTGVLLRHHGTIDEFIGDAILAIFGAPSQLPDHATRAVASGIEMQLAMAEVNRWNRQRGFPDIAMGIGINTGEVVVGNIGSEKRSKYGVVGAQVNLTSRIESYTAGGQILVSESTRNACGADLRVASAREVSPKGLASPITIFEVSALDGGYDLDLPTDS